MRESLLNSNTQRTALLVASLLCADGCRFSYEIIPKDDGPNPSTTGGLGGALGSGGDAGSDSGGAPATGGTSTGGMDLGGGPSSGGEPGTGGAEPQIPDDWWDGAFRTRVRIDIDNSSLGSALDAFPVLLRLAGGAYDTALSGSMGDALRFVDDDHTTELAYEIERGATLDDSVIWIRVPRIDAAPAVESFWLYYDNPSAGPGEQPPLVWSNGFVAVYHLNGDLSDSTSTMLDGTTGSATPAAGQSVDGYDFQSTSTPVILGTPAPLNNIFNGGATISLWLNARSYGNSSYPRLLDKSNNTTGGSGWALQLHNSGAMGNRVHFEHDFLTNVGQWQSNPDQIVVPGSQSVAVSFDSTNIAVAPTIYVDGTPRGIALTNPPTGGLVDDSSLPLTVGERSGAADRSYDGIMDEIRISGVIRSADWIATEDRCLVLGCTSISMVVDTLD